MNSAQVTPEIISSASAVNCPWLNNEKSKLVLTNTIPTNPKRTPATFFGEIFSPSSLGLRIATHIALRFMKSAAFAAVV